MSGAESARSESLGSTSRITGVTMVPRDCCAGEEEENDGDDDPRAWLLLLAAAAV